MAPPAAARVHRFRAADYDASVSLP